jgi:PAS domain S-box-containing protein
VGCPSLVLEGVNGALGQLSPSCRNRTVEVNLSSQNLEDELEKKPYLILDAGQSPDEAMTVVLESVTDYAIYILDPRGHVLCWNVGAERIKGYAQDEVLGSNFSMFFAPEDVAAGLPEKELAAAARDGRFEAQGWCQRKGGERFWALATLTAIRLSNGELHGFARTTRDIMQQKILEDGRAKLSLELEERVRERTAQLKATADELLFKNEKIEGLVATIRKDLDDKEVLLQEVYHRVKNNLQVVQSLLSIGARTIGDGDGRSAIATAIQRVHVVATVHERLYQTPGLASLTPSTYLRDIAEGAIAANSDQSNQIQLQMDFDEIPLPLDLAVPFGLLAYELISNCLKHGLSEGRPGTIFLSARIVPGAVRFVVSDNGKGLPENFDASKCRSMGLKLASSLARQLGGRLEFSSNNGCRVEAALARLLPQQSQLMGSTAWAPISGHAGSTKRERHGKGGALAWSAGIDPAVQ